MTTKTSERLDDPRLGKRATYIGREVGMRITGTIFRVDRYIWIRDDEGRERGADPKNVRLLER